MTPGEVMPGENVNLMISSKPNSFVGLLGIDQRSILLKSGNDISHVCVIYSSYLIFAHFYLFSYRIILIAFAALRKKCTKNCVPTILEKYRRIQIRSSIVHFGDPAREPRMMCFKYNKSQYIIIHARFIILFRFLIQNR